MGIDWYRMSPKPGCDEAELRRLVDQQAAACDGDRFDTPFAATSRALQDLLVLPPWDDAAGMPTDYPDLLPCWRVYAITDNTVFPPSWRSAAHRTFLPQELRRQVERWKAWSMAVADGQHADYLRGLFVHETSTWLAYHREELKKLAEESRGVTAAWAAKPEVASLREKIKALPATTIYPAPPEPTSVASMPTAGQEADPPVAAIWDEINETVALTHAWDRKVKGQWKLRYYERAYSTFEQYLQQSRDPWLCDFYRWAERCASMGFGLFLDG